MPHPQIDARNQLKTLAAALPGFANNVVGRKLDVIEKRPFGCVFLDEWESSREAAPSWMARRQKIAVVLADTHATDIESHLLDLALTLERAVEVATWPGNSSMTLDRPNFLELAPDSLKEGQITLTFLFDYTQDAGPP